MLSAGDRIGDWIIVEPLGAGGMGSIFLARSVLSERVRAACKVMHARDDFNTRERFIREVDTLASLNHPAIVRVLSGGDDPARGILYLFMEYLEGEDLRKRLSRGPLSQSEAYNVFRQVGSGLQHAHARGVTHRDIKPANIMLGRDGSARLVDFGIAAAEGRTSLTREGMLPGTLPYIDPVAFSGGKPEFKLADIYAIGLVLWESLTGRMAFPEESDSSAGQQMVRMMRLKLESEALDPGPGFPDALRRLVMRATEPEPDKRLPSMDAFLEQLAAAFTGRPEILAQSTGENPLATSAPPSSRSGGFGAPASVADLWMPRGPGTGGRTMDDALGPRSGGQAAPSAGPKSGPQAPPPSGPSRSGPNPAPASGAHSGANPAAPTARPKSRAWIWGVVALLGLFSCVGVGGLVVLFSSITVSDTGSVVQTPTPQDNNGAFNPFQVDVNIPNPVVTTTTPDAAKAAATARVGETTVFGPYKLKVVKTRRKGQVSHEVFRHQAQEGWDLLLIKLTLENTAPGDVSLMSPFTLIDHHPYQFNQSVACQLALADGLEAIPTVPGQGRIEGEVCFEVARDAKGLKLRFQPDMMNTSWNLQVDLGE